MNGRLAEQITHNQRYKEKTTLKWVGGAEMWFSQYPHTKMITHQWEEYQNHSGPTWGTRSPKPTMGSTVQGTCTGKMSLHNIWLWSYRVYAWKMQRVVGNTDFTLKWHAHDFTCSETQHRDISLKNTWVIHGDPLTNIRQGPVGTFPRDRSNDGHSFFSSWPSTDTCCSSTARPDPEFPYGLAPSNPSARPRLLPMAHSLTTVSRWPQLSPEPIPSSSPHTWWMPSARIRDSPKWLPVLPVQQTPSASNRAPPPPSTPIQGSQHWTPECLQESQSDFTASCIRSLSHPPVHSLHSS